MRPIAFSSIVAPRALAHNRRRLRSTATCSLSAEVANGADAGVAAVTDAQRFRKTMVVGAAQRATPIDFVTKDHWEQWVSEQSAETQRWLRTIGLEKWSAKGGVTVIPSFDSDAAGDVAKVVVPMPATGAPLWSAARLPGVVPKDRVYRVDHAAGLSGFDVEVGWALGAYRYTKYKGGSKGADAKDAVNGEDSKVAQLVRCTAGKEATLVDSCAAATFMVRDIINTPCEDFGPAQLEAACRTVSAACNARITVVAGDKLKHGYPQVHTVGRAAGVGREPRVIELVWNNAAARTVTLVGKGVVYDTGGLSLKSTAGMKNMKADLGGAAQMLGLFSMVAANALNLRLRLLIPAVENAVSSDSYRPGDVLTARNGKTTLNVDSDAEGRLCLADCLAAAAEESPELIVDCATLTGARTVALGSELPAMFANDDDVADAILRACDDANDAMWRMPLYEPYRGMLDCSIADVQSCGDRGTPDAIVAALYLREFVGDTPWVHIDTGCWISTSKPGRPDGGDAMGMRALFHYLRNTYGAPE